PHVPRVPHERFQGKSGLGPRGDAILQFDWCVGEVTAALERLGLAEKTLMVVCSDNGPVMDDGYVDFALEKRGNHRAGGPLRGGKYSVFEGGTRTPFIARWKGAVAPRVSDEIVCTIDLAASFAALAGEAVPANGFPDSFDVSGALLGRAGAKGRASLVQQDNGQAGNYGYRAGNWKLVRHDSKQAYNQRIEEQLRNTPVPEFQLFDLAQDIGET
ncbi:MAG: sulfatase-like hydrolase/transferase, partial [Opitutaceae bacterium]